jgi:hypothetical protein
MKQIFLVKLLVNQAEISQGRVEVDSRALTRVTDAWRKNYFPALTDDEKIVAHLAYRLIFFNARLSQMSGWDDLPDHYLRQLDRIEGPRDSQIVVTLIENIAQPDKRASRVAVHLPVMFATDSI